MKSPTGKVDAIARRLCTGTESPSGPGRTEGMRSSTVLGMVLSVGTLAACGGGDAMRSLERPPPAVALGRTMPRLPAASGDGAGSSLALARMDDRRLALVADADSHAVRLLDTRSGEELPQLDLPGEPAQLVVGGDGRVFVSLRDRAEVDVLEPTTVGEAGRVTLRVQDRMATAEEPVGLAADPRRAHAAGGVRLGPGPRCVLDADAGPRVPRAGRARAPRGRDQRRRPARLRLPRQRLGGERRGPDVARPRHPRAAPGAARQRAARPASSPWRQGFTLARAEFGILAPGVEADTGDTTVRSETYGGIEATSMPAEQFSVSVIDEDRSPGRAAWAAAPPRGLDEPPDGASAFTECLLPRASAYDAHGRVARRGLRGQGHGRAPRRARRKGRRAAGRVEGRGRADAALALDADRREGFVWSQGARTITVVPARRLPPVGRHARPGRPGAHRGPGRAVGEPDAVAKGRQLFHTTGDPRISSDGRACASCHPDGRDDGLVWATPDGPRQTPTLAGRLAGTAPYGWNGSRGDGEEARHEHPQAPGRHRPGGRSHGRAGRVLHGDEAAAARAPCEASAGPTRWSRRARTCSVLVHGVLLVPHVGRDLHRRQPPRRGEQGQGRSAA